MKLIVQLSQYEERYVTNYLVTIYNHLFVFFIIFSYIMYLYCFSGDVFCNIGKKNLNMLCNVSNMTIELYRQMELRLDHSIPQQVLEVYQAPVDKVVLRVVGAARGWGLSVHRFILLRSKLTLLLLFILL